jgi:TIR domain-containing protein/SIR2-like protein
LSRVNPLPLSDATDSDDETLWGVLLDYIDEGTVVPVVGRDLLVVEAAADNGQTVRVPLYSLIAAELDRRLFNRPPGRAPDPALVDGPNPLGAVASEFIVQGGNPNRIYSALPQILATVQKRVQGMPEALRKLAEITPFRVFVTTTFDPLLADCLERIRRVTPNVMAYAPGAAGMLSEFKIGTTRADTLELLKGLPPVVVHILGKLSSTPNYVVTEEDAFEFVYLLHDTRPEGLFDLLAQMKMLIVGCRFPSWLVRFFLRAARRKRLLQSSLDRTDFVVDPAAAEDAALVQFLRNFKTQTEIFTRYQPTEFVDQLHRRWIERTGADVDPTADAITPLSIFISYASQDAAAAARIAGLIADAKLPVWLDRGRLGSGDDWARKIARNIDIASAFVPIVSRSTLVDGQREFRREWRQALHVKSGLPQTEEFIYPLVIDDVPRGSDAIDRELRALNWEPLGPDGSLPQGFVDRIRKAYRTAQLRGIRG